ncbi:hypothetical protein B0H34DRAFT_731978 [Crassisporium funariophilum]|nr:hypothetical protein B0H34DRAFT_731978 [Crassisporium funariophilum]
MFSVVKALSLFLAVSQVFASPLVNKRDTSNVVSRASNISFNNWGGLSSLAGFDDFFGNDNFDGRRNQQAIIIEQQQVCSSQNVFLIQQQLSIILEVAKKAISQQICDVETQIIVLEQFRGGVRNFQRDLRRQSGRNVGFDNNVAILIIQLFNGDGSFNNKDFGFRGRDIGSNTIAPSGSNWNDATSPQSVDSILKSIKDAETIEGPK